MNREDVKRLLTKHELDFGLVAERLKRALGLKTDAELAAKLGMSGSNFANRKAGNSIPYDLVLPLCLIESISLDWLFTGKGHEFTDRDQATSRTAPLVGVDGLLLATAITRLDQAFHDVSAEITGKKEYLAMLAIHAADIYNGAILKDSDEARLKNVFLAVDKLATFALGAGIADEVQRRKARLLADSQSEQHD